MRLAAPALAIALLALASLGAQIRVMAAVPSDGDWRAVARTIQERARPDDLVLLDPAWAEQGRLFLRGPRVEAWPVVVADDLLRAGRVWSVAHRAAPFARPERLGEELEAAGARALEPPRAFGELLLGLFQAPSRSVQFDFTSRAADATVTAGPSGILCGKDARGWHHCPGGSWQFVGAGDFEIGYGARRCVYAHPLGPRDNPLTINWRQAALGRWVRFRAGLIAATALNETAAPVEIAVLVDGAELGAVSVASRAGFRSFAVDTARAGPGAHTVALVVSAANPDWRHLCFDAWAE